MHSKFLAPLAALLVTGCSSVVINTRPATPEEAQAGDAMARKMTDAMGGLENYRKLRFISFDFVVEVAGFKKHRTHHDWDPQRNVARVVRGDEEVFLNCADRTGRVFDNGKEVTDPEDRKDALESAYAAWVNDTYWLVSPFKLFDDGVRRAWIDGKLRVSFEEKIGLTPGDVYQYELAEDGKPVQWAFNLQSGMKADARFLEPVTHDGVTLYSYKPGKVLGIRLGGLDFSATPRPEVFKGL